MRQPTFPLPTSGAEVAYDQLEAQIELKLKEIKQFLKEHALKAKKDSKNWGLVGDLQHYLRLLKQIPEPE
jgi:hypothetical protein